MLRVDGMRYFHAHLVSMTLTVLASCDRNRNDTASRSSRQRAASALRMRADGPWPSVPGLMALLLADHSFQHADQQRSKQHSARNTPQHAAKRVIRRSTQCGAYYSTARAAEAYGTSHSTAREGSMSRSASRSAVCIM